MAHHRLELSPTPSCHEGDTAGRAVALMQVLGLEVVPVVNDNDTVTGVAVAIELDRALLRPGGETMRLREVMQRLGFVVCRLSDGLEMISSQLLHRPARYAVVLADDGRCLGVVDALVALDAAHAAAR